MAQFDVCRNTGRSRGGFPYFVVVQSAEFDRTERRLVVPLTSQIAGYPKLAPVFVVERKRVVADALLMFAMPRDRLGEVVGSLADDASATAIVGAVDRVISRGFG
jgi:mRNA-degrading endonuclease toxin of MazEF toxin-antitoxin module